MSPCFPSFWSMSLRVSLYLSARFLIHCDSPLSRVCGVQFCFLLLINKIMFIRVLQVCPLRPDSVSSIMSSSRSPRSNSDNTHLHLDPGFLGSSSTTAHAYFTCLPASLPQLLEIITSWNLHHLTTYLQ